MRSAPCKPPRNLQKPIVLQLPAPAHASLVPRENSVASALVDRDRRMSKMAAASAASEVPVVIGGATDDVGKAAATSSWPPAVADRYKHPVKVGQGMFGRVYAAWDSVDEQLVAVKQLSGRTDDEFVATGPGEYAQEVMALEACRGNPNVVNLLATFADDCTGNLFIVTEFAGSMNLRRYVQLRYRQGPPFSEDEVRDAMAQLLSGVASAHDAGVLHREVVPENVIVDDQQQQMEKKKKKMACKYTVCGFNASERAGATAKDGSSLLASSSPYRAPEVFLGSDHYNDRIDTWGLGCIMAELIAGTGGVPFFSRELDNQVFPGMLHVVGAKGLVEWSGLERVVTPQQASELREQYSRDTGILREVFPKKMLSHAGFDVLSGLLQSNPDRRLTAAAALKMPWFRRRGHILGTCFTSPVTHASGY